MLAAAIQQQQAQVQALAVANANLAAEASQLRWEVSSMGFLRTEIGRLRIVSGGLTPPSVAQSATSHFFSSPCWWCGLGSLDSGARGCAAPARLVAGGRLRPAHCAASEASLHLQDKETVALELEDCRRGMAALGKVCEEAGQERRAVEAHLARRLATLRWRHAGAAVLASSWRSNEQLRRPHRWAGSLPRSVGTARGGPTCTWLAWLWHGWPPGCSQNQSESEAWLSHEGCFPCPGLQRVEGCRSRADQHPAEAGRRA